MSKTTHTLIALVPIAVMVHGERQVVQPGQPLPELTPADSAALLGAKAAREASADTDATAAPAAQAPAAAPEPAGPEGDVADAGAASPPAAAPAPAPATKTRKR